MDMLEILRISSSGMRAQRTRMEAIATNLANVNSTKSDEGGPFRKKRSSSPPATYRKAARSARF